MDEQQINRLYVLKKEHTRLNGAFALSNSFEDAKAYSEWNNANIEELDFLELLFNNRGK